METNLQDICVLTTLYSSVRLPVTVAEVEKLPGAGEDEERHLRIAENGQLASFLHQSIAPLRECYLPRAFVLDSLYLQLLLPHFSRTKTLTTFFYFLFFYFLF